MEYKLFGTVELLNLSFERFAEGLTTDLSLAAPDETERLLLIEEVKVGCTIEMLQCLDRTHRLTYVLGEIMELSGPEAAEVLDVSPDLFRKRLQQVRSAILTFTRTYCGLASGNATCRCNRQLPYALAAGKVHSDSFSFASAPSSFRETRAKVGQVDEARWTLEVHRSSHTRASSIDFARRLLETLDLRLDHGSQS